MAPVRHWFAACRQTAVYLGVRWWGWWGAAARTLNLRI